MKRQNAFQLCFFEKLMANKVKGFLLEGGGGDLLHTEIKDTIYHQFGGGKEKGGGVIKKQCL